MKPLFRYVLLTTAVIVTVLSPSAAEKTGDTKLGEKNAEEALWDFVEEEAAPLPGANQTASAPLSAGGGFTSGRERFGLSYVVLPYGDVEKGDIPGMILVTGMARDTAAHETTIKTGDYIEAIDGVKIRTSSFFESYIDNCEDGHIARLTVYRKKPDGSWKKNTRKMVLTADEELLFQQLAAIEEEKLAREEAERQAEAARLAEEAARAATPTFTPTPLPTSTPAPTFDSGSKRTITFAIDPIMDEDTVYALIAQAENEGFRVEYSYVGTDTGKIPAYSGNASWKEEYIFWDADQRLITDSELRRLDAQTACYAKNEIYARHGRKFRSEELQEYFGGKSWYQGTVEPSWFSEGVFNSYEAANAVALLKREYAAEDGGYDLDQPGYDISAVGTISLK